MKKSVVATAIVIALAGLAVAAVPVVERRAASHIKAEIERGGQAKVDSVSVGLFDRSVTMTGITSSLGGSVAAERWAISGLAWPIGELLLGNVPFAGLRLGDPVHADRIEVKGLRFADTVGQSWAVGSIVMEGVDLARYDGDIPPSPYGFTILGARILRALSLRHFEEREVAYTGPGTATAIAIAAIVLDDVVHGKFGALSLAGFQAAGKTPAEPLFKLDQVKAGGLDLQRVLASMSAATWHINAPLGRIQLASGTASGFGGEVLARYGVSLGSVTTETAREGDGVTRGRTRIDGFVLAPPRSLEGLQLRLVLAAMGLKEVKLEFECSGIEDRNKGEVTVGPCALTGPDLGNLDLALKLVQADERFWRAMDSGDLFAVYSTEVAIGSARLAFSDRSLLERSVKAIAASSGQPVAQVRSTLAQQVRQFQPAGVLITEDMTKLLDTVARFIEQGGTLAIDLKPDPPFGLDKIGYLQRPGPDLIGLLGVTATLSGPPR